MLKLKVTWHLDGVRVGVPRERKRDANAIMLKLDILDQYSFIYLIKLLC